jgi:hypothetical protein
VDGTRYGIAALILIIQQFAPQKETKTAKSDNNNMKEITLKTILIIDNEEILVGSSDFSQTIAEYEKEQGYELDNDEILDYIQDED